MEPASTHSAFYTFCEFNHIRLEETPKDEAIALVVLQNLQMIHHVQGRLSNLEFNGEGRICQSLRTEPVPVNDTAVENLEKFAKLIHTHAKNVFSGLDPSNRGDLRAALQGAQKDLETYAQSDSIAKKYIPRIKDVAQRLAAADALMQADAVPVSDEVETDILSSLSPVKRRSSMEATSKELEEAETRRASRSGPININKLITSEASGLGSDIRQLRNPDNGLSQRTKKWIAGVGIPGGAALLAVGAIISGPVLGPILLTIGGVALLAGLVTGWKAGFTWAKTSSLEEVRQALLKLKTTLATGENHQKLREFINTYGNYLPQQQLFALLREDNLLEGDLYFICDKIFQPYREGREPLPGDLERSKEIFQRIGWDWNRALGKGTDGGDIDEYTRIAKQVMEKVQPFPPGYG